MSYNKYTWTDGETITAAKLNHMEDGIADSESGDNEIVIVKFSYSNGGYSADKTFSEIGQELMSGKMIVGINIGDGVTYPNISFGMDSLPYIDFVGNSVSTGDTHIVSLNVTCMRLYNDGSVKQCIGRCNTDS